MMSAGIDRIDSCAVGCEVCKKYFLHGFELGPAIITAANSGLVCDHDDGNAAIVGSRDYVCCPRNYGDVVGPAEVARLIDNGAITVKEQGRAAARRATQDLGPYTLRVERVFSGTRRFDHYCSRALRR